LTEIGVVFEGIALGLSAPGVYGVAVGLVTGVFMNRPPNSRYGAQNANKRGVYLCVAA
jgi:hypothetical protein